MVPYLSSTEIPSNWNKLLERSTEHATEEQYEIANKWLHPQINQQDHKSETYLILGKLFLNKKPMSQ